MNNNNKIYLDKAHEHAVKYSGCKKVKVGCIITCYDREHDDHIIIAKGANIAIPHSCSTLGCLREQKYGENNKEHRNPDDCRAVHSEAVAIATLLRWKPHPFPILTVYITRYPCEACARLLVLIGVRKVVYGRQQETSEMTKDIFRRWDVEEVWERTWIESDVTN